MASTSAIVKSPPGRPALALADDTLGSNINNTTTNPLTSNTAIDHTNEDPRSISEQDIGLISRIQDDENTFTGEGDLSLVDDDEPWNADNGGYKIEGDTIGSLSHTAGMTFSQQPYDTFDANVRLDASADGHDPYDHEGAWEAQHPLKALFDPPSPLQRSFTAPVPEFPLTLQERRLQLRNSHMRATPMASSLKTDDVQAKGLSRAANALRSKHFQSLGRASTVSSRLSDITASDDEFIIPSRKRSPRGSLGSLPSIHASLRHTKTPSIGQSDYIEHLERQISDLNQKLRSYTDPTGEKSHAAVVQRLNAKVRSLENQVTEWENVFDERIREAERIHSRDRTSYVSQIKMLREQVDLLNQTVANMEDELDLERKQNIALTLAVTEKKALAMDNAQLAQALTQALGEIAELEAAAQEREDTLFGHQATLGSLMIDVTPKPKQMELFGDLNNASSSTADLAKDPFSQSEPGLATLSPTTSNASTQDIPLKRKMRKFPSGISGPKQLILSPTSSRRSSGEFMNRGGHSRNTSSSWSPYAERIHEHNSLFAELEKAQEDGVASNINDETLSNIGSQAPAEAEISDAEQEHLEHNTSPPTSPTDTETSDSEDSPRSHASASSSSSRLGSGVAYVLFSPIRVTSSVVAAVGRSVLSPRSTINNMRQLAMEQLLEVSELEESFGSDIVFGDQYDEHLRSGGRRITSQSPELRSTGSVRSTGTGLSIDLKDILDNNTDSITTSMTPPNKGNGTLHRRSNRRKTPQSQLSEDVQVVFAGRRMTDDQDTPTPTPSKARKKGLKAESSKPILPIKPRQDVRERLQRKRATSNGLGILDRRVSLPPPYSEYPNFSAGVRDDGWRTEDSRGEISSSGEDDFNDTTFSIPESQLARVLRQDLDNGSLLKAMGLTSENNMVLWTKLFMGFVVTMFVALRDGPSVALEKMDGQKEKPTPKKAREIRRLHG
ncbi:hypothetical protein ABW19_dt0200533 [Dactylella cylindrospora]|nr:hypothetical protein ABW19_dt0200533 [Dactylella cylindrospora]